jgi:transcriptional regulator with GAF, ATPase, and Fis domain
VPDPAFSIFSGEGLWNRRHSPCISHKPEPSTIPVKTLKEIRQEHIRTVLEENGWDIEKASHILQIPERRLRTEAKRLTKPPGKLNEKGGRSRGPKGEEK